MRTRTEHEHQARERARATAHRRSREAEQRREDALYRRYGDHWLMTSFVEYEGPGLLDTGRTSYGLDPRYQQFLGRLDRRPRIFHPTPLDLGFDLELDSKGNVAPTGDDRVDAMMYLHNAVLARLAEQQSSRGEWFLDYDAGVPHPLFKEPA